MIRRNKIIKSLLISLGILFVGVFLLFFLDTLRSQQSGILVESEPVSDVFINNALVGQTPYEANLASGLINIKIVPQTDTLNLDGYETKLILVPGVRTIVKRVFRPTIDESSGVLVSFEKFLAKESYVSIISVPDNAEVKINGKVYGLTPLRVSLPAGDYQLIVTADGYLEKSLPVKVYKGYKLTASVKLAKQQTENNIFKDSEIQVLGDQKIMKRVKISKTDTGFLRVRDGSGTDYLELGQIHEGQEFDVFEEDASKGWLKIKFINSEGIPIEGWISAEFAEEI